MTPARFKFEASITFRLPPFGIWNSIDNGCLFRRAHSITLVCISFAYPVFGLWSKTNGFKPSTGLTLDGNKYIKEYNQDEWAGIEWLKSAPEGVIAEAIGGDYTGYARISTLSGIPTVLGWPGHVSQWRGGNKEMGTRQTDIETLYQTLTWETALLIIKEYNIKYIYIGDLERATYHINSIVFDTDLKLVFQQGSVTIYQVPDQLGAITIGPQTEISTP